MLGGAMHEVSTNRDGEQLNMHGAVEGAQLLPQNVKEPLAHRLRQTRASMHCHPARTIMHVSSHVSQCNKLIHMAL
jgi:hypothetical protein